MIASAHVELIEVGDNLVWVLLFFGVAFMYWARCKYRATWMRETALHEDAIATREDERDLLRESVKPAPLVSGPGG